MRRNRSRRAKDGVERYDKVYVEWPHLWEVKQVVARPLKTIYINRSSAPWAQNRDFSGVYSLENFCDRWGLELP
jgi:ABC-type arginine transport system ATPase subunit